MAPNYTYNEDTGEEIWNGSAIPAVAHASDIKAATIDNTTSNPMMSVGADTSSSGNSGGIGSGTGGAALGAGEGIVTNFGKNQEANRSAQYDQQLAKWQQDGQNWFDPNYNVDPDIDKLLNQMPSESMSMTKGDLWGADKGTQETLGTVLDPGTMGLSKIFGGQSTSTGRALQHGASEGGKGFIEGFSAGGLWGGIIGGVAGTLTGFFGYNDAEKRDNEKRKQMRDDLERQLAVYNEKKRVQGIQNKNNADEAFKQIESQKQTEAANASDTRRGNFLRLMKTLAPNQHKFSYAE